MGGGGERERWSHGGSRLALRSTCSSTRSGEGGGARWAQVQGGGHDHHPQGPRSSLLHCQWGQAKQVRRLCPPRATVAPGRCCPCPTSWRPRRRTRTSPGGTHLLEAGGPRSVRHLPSSRPSWYLEEPGAGEGGRVRRGGGPTGVGEWGACLGQRLVLSSPTRSQPTGSPEGPGQLHGQRPGSSPRLPPLRCWEQGLGLCPPPPRCLWQWAVWSFRRGGDGQTERTQVRVGLGWAHVLHHSCPPGVSKALEQEAHPSRPTACPAVGGHGPPAPGPPAPGCSWLRAGTRQRSLSPSPGAPGPPASTSATRHHSRSSLAPVALAGHGLGGYLYSWGGAGPAAHPAQRPRPPPPSCRLSLPQPGLHGSWQLLQPVLHVAACADPTRTERSGGPQGPLPCPEPSQAPHLPSPGIRSRQPHSHMAWFSDGGLDRARPGGGAPVCGPRPGFPWPHPLR